MSETDGDDDMEDVGTTPTDFFDHEPSKQEKIEMRKTSKPPSEWLKLLCKDWAEENEVLVETTDARFLEYKPFLKGMLTSQLLCRLSIPPSKDAGMDTSAQSSTLDFWRMLGIEDEFDKSYIVAQVERFCSLYNIRGPYLDEAEGLLGADFSNSDPATLAAAAAAGLNVSPSSGFVPLQQYMSDTCAAAAAAAAAAQADVSKLSKKQVSEVSRAHRMAKDAEKALENERRQNMKREQRRLSQQRKEEKAREREAQAVRKAAERAAREASREDRRRKKLEIRQQREKFANEQKEAALRRAAELVASNRVPIEITRGASAAKAAAAAMTPPQTQQHQDTAQKKPRSAIVVSTAADLHAIVMHSKNLWAKYNAIAKEHNQKVNWITVAKELGIHVKVREKYARMHSRAEQRGFDWEKNGHWKIKDHPEVFLEPTQAEQKAKMPPPPPPESQTVLIDGNKEVTDEAVAAAASVVDATVTSPPVDAVVQTTEEQTAAAAAVAAAVLVADPTAGLTDQSAAV